MSIDEIWNYCDKKQKEYAGNTDPSPFIQGMIISLRNVQYKINGKCTNITISEMFSIK